MNYLIIKDGIIDNIIVCENDEIASKFGAVASYNDARIGTNYNPPGLTTAERREVAYNTEPIIKWNDDLITVDKAVQLWSSYTAENNIEIATQLSVLIAEAKQIIRNRYTDV